MRFNLFRLSNQFACATVIVAVAFLGASGSAFADPIHDAAGKGNLAKVKELVKDNPSLVSSKDKFGKTPLHLAAANDREDVAKFLLESGADVNARDSNGGFTPLDAAFSSYHYKEMVELLIAKGADVNAKADNGSTPLHQAATRGQKDVVPLLLSNNADVDARDTKGNTPLLWALMMGHSDVAELLIVANADVDVKGSMGFTPLFFARRSGNTKLQELLRQHGAHE